METKEILNKLLEHIGLNAKSFSEKIGLDRPQAIYDIQKGKTKSISPSMAIKINSVYPEVNKSWLLSGEGPMLKSETSDKHIIEERTGNLIPFYDDVVSIGGNNEVSANMQGISQPADYIDTGDWFKDATAAIRHYGDSMIEYPSGCIIAIKEVYDRELIIPGRDYMIETSEYRVTKRIQKGHDDDHITAYSTNTETYSDGRLIHEPFNIPWRSVQHIALVLGYVVKKNGGTIMFNRRNQ
jgi:plasmid maintenance system antidote protein VapI